MLKLRSSFVLIILFGLGFTAASFAQDRSGAPQNAAEEAAGLRAQLIEVQSKEAALQVRASELDEAMKPENIERAFAGIGSTRPEELREQRRRQLSIEREGVRKQLELLATSRARLESAILAADGRAYQQSAQQSYSETLMYPAKRLWVVVGAATLVGLLGIVALITFIRRR